MYKKNQWRWFFSYGAKYIYIYVHLLRRDILQKKMERREKRKKQRKKQKNKTPGGDILKYKKKIKHYTSISRKCHISRMI